MITISAYDVPDEITFTDTTTTPTPAEVDTATALLTDAGIPTTSYDE